MSEADFDCIVAVNMKAIHLAMCELVLRMKANAPGLHGMRGVVLNRASTAGVSPRPRLAWCHASKGWVITATRASAVEPAAAGMRVVALDPVAGETPLLESFMGRDTPEMRAKFLPTIPDRPLFHARGPRQRRLLPVQRRGLHDHRRLHGSRRRKMYLVSEPLSPSALEPLRR